MNDLSQMPPDLESGLELVRRTMADTLQGTVFDRLAFDAAAFLGGGKLLRARAVLRLAPAVAAPAASLIRSAAAVELVHGASLLHDDVIDGGRTRRGAPAFWTLYGAHGAILAGDILLGKALETLSATGNASLIARLAQAVAEVCSAESEQELLLRGRTADWDTAVRLARAKTGPLFAFAAGAAAGDDVRLAANLREAGYLAGTAYQLSDDVLDVVGCPVAAGKTLGTDERRAKHTAARAHNGDPSAAIAGVEAFCAASAERLTDWPEIQACWLDYLDLDLRPAMDQNMRAADEPARAAG